MLEQILSSPGKSAVISFLLAAPPRSFSARELSKRLRLSPGKLSSALRELVSAGAVNKFSKGKQTFYIANPRHKILEELRAGLKKSKRTYPDELFTAIRGLGLVRAAFLSGVFSGQPQLPVDVLLVGKINLRKLDAFLRGCKKMTGLEVNYSVMSEKEFKLRHDTFDRFIKDIFDYPHLTVVNTLRSAKEKPYVGF